MTRHGHLTIAVGVLVLLTCICAGCATIAVSETTSSSTSDAVHNTVVIVPNQNPRTTAVWQAGMSGIRSALRSSGIPFEDMETALQSYSKRSTKSAAVQCSGTALSCGILKASSAGYSHAIAFVVSPLTDGKMQGAILVFDAGYCVSVTTFTAEKASKKSFEQKARIKMTMILNSNIFQHMPDERGIAPLHK